MKLLKQLNELLKPANIDFISVYEDFYMGDQEFKGGVKMEKNDIKMKARELIQQLDQATSDGKPEEIQKVSKAIVDFLLQLTELE